MDSLKNKKVLITGASRGIGKAIALQLAQLGASVALHYHTDIQQAKAVLKKMSTSNAKLFQADLSIPNQVIQLAEDVWEKMDGIDILVNNAGISYKKHFLDTTLEDLEKFTNVNFRGTFLLTQRIAQKMVADNVEGSIYTITSINGIQPGVGLSAYGATKGALETLMKGVALELAPHNIKVNTIAVGAIQTDINAGVWENPELLKSVNDNIPMGRFGQPEEVAAIVCNLLSAGSYITGSTIKADGGWMLKQGFVKPEKYSKK